MLNIEFVSKVFIFRSMFQVQSKNVSVVLLLGGERGEQEKSIKHKMLLCPWNCHQTQWEGVLIS